MSILLAQSDEGGARVSVAEFENMFWLFAVAGNETLRNGLPGACIALLEYPRAQDELRRSEAYLAEAQRLTHTGSFAFDIATRTIVHWSLEHFRLFGFDPDAGLPSFEAVAARIHPNDSRRFGAILERAIREGVDVDQDFRIVRPDGTTKYIHGVSHPVFNAAGALDKLIGTVVDVTELKRVDQERERLRQVQADLTHMSRVTTMGELTASLAHEVNQPIAAAVTDAKTCLRWLERATPDIDEARHAAARVVTDVTRAAEIISGIRLLFTKGTPQREVVDVNDVVREMIVMLRGEAAEHGISVRTELATDAPRVAGDRVQLQQVMMNLILNGIDSMKEIPGARELVVRSRPTDEGVAVDVSDTGPGVPARHAGEIFNAFFTTKAQGIGMGLSISRSIVESHGGKLWAADNLPRGARFHLSLPGIAETNESAGRRSDSLHHR